MNAHSLRLATLLLACAAAASAAAAQPAAARRLAMIRPGVIDAELAVVSSPAPARR